MHTAPDCYGYVVASLGAPCSYKYAAFCGGTASVVQIAQHHINSVHHLSKMMGWPVLSLHTPIGIGDMEPIGNALAIMIESPNGKRWERLRAHVCPHRCTSNFGYKTLYRLAYSILYTCSIYYGFKLELTSKLIRILRIMFCDTRLYSGR